MSPVPNPFAYVGPPSGEVRSCWRGGETIPGARDLPRCPGVRWTTIQPARPTVAGGLAFQHGVHLVWHGETLLASWAVNLATENTGGEFVQVRQSDDLGRTWRDHSVLRPPAGTGALSHGVMLSREGRLLAWLAAFEGRLQGVHTRQYEWHESERCWRETGPVIDGGFWPLQEPQAVAPEAWVMAGFLVTEGNLPAVARAAEPGGAAWTLHCIQREDTAPAWSESAVIRWQDRLINVSRHGPTRRLYWAESDDGGRTWSPARPTDLPFADTKPCAGVLADGRPYLIGTTSADTVMRRDPLTLALGPAGEDPGFDQVWSLRPAVLAGETAVESHAEALLSYAHAVERDGHLYVAYSNTGGRPGANLNSIELAVVPVPALR